MSCILDNVPNRKEPHKMIVIENLKLYDIDDVSEICGCSTRTLRRDMNAGRLEGYYIGRAWYFTDKAIEEYKQKKGVEI